MKTKFAQFFSLFLLFTHFSWAQTEEKNADFTVSPNLMTAGTIQYGFDWLAPHEFSRSALSVIDNQNIESLHPGNNQLVLAKIAFTSKKSFDSLSGTKMNNAKFISAMLNSNSISQKNSESWSVTNTVKAYGLPFKVSFDFKIKEVSASSLNGDLVRYFRDEASALSSPGRERFLILDMGQFTQLIYRNYSIVYVKEISATETLIVSGLITGFDLKSANSFFNYPPFSTTKETMLKNLRNQILQMARGIQK
jgi:hypothetical protein